MRAKFKCENCLTETSIGGQGNITLFCQSCGCGDIKFDVNVIVAPVSVSDPGKKFDPVSVEKDESFLGFHSSGGLWNLSFPDPEVPATPPPIIKRKGKDK